MRAVIQRVKEARVRVDGNIVGSIEGGLCIFVGIAADDDDEDRVYLARKIPRMRLFPEQHAVDDGPKRMTRSVLDFGGDILLISQFTLCAETHKGTRPSFGRAMEPAAARLVFDRLAEDLRRELKAKELNVEVGMFGAMMEVGLVNDGPVTILLDSKNRR